MKIRIKNILKYEVLQYPLFVAITVFNTLIAMEFVRLGFRGVEQVLNGRITVYEVQAVYRATFTAYIVAVAIYCFLGRNGIYDFIRKLINLTVQGIFLCFGGSLTALGMLTITVTNQIIFDYSLVYLSVVLMVSIIVKTMDKTCYRKWLKQTDPLEYERQFLVKKIKIDNLQHSFWKQPQEAQKDNNESQ